jgi:hypothetical protein
VITAKDQLRPPKWTRVDNMEWGGRTLGPNFIFKSFQAEHHATKQTFESLGEQARAMLYFFPSGYVEQCVMHIAFRKGAYEIDPDQEPYTVIINSAEGTASVTSGETDYEFKAHDEV